MLPSPTDILADHFLINLFNKTATISEPTVYFISLVMQVA